MAQNDPVSQDYDDYASEEDAGYGDAGYGETGYEDEVPASPRRTQATFVMVLASIVFVASLVILAAFVGDSEELRDLVDFWSFTTWIWVFVGILGVFLIWLFILLVTAPPREAADWYEEDQYPVAEYGELGAPDTITLRCPRCQNIFSLQDPMARPFYHDCPHCDVRGVYTGSEDPPDVRARLAQHGQAS